MTDITIVAFLPCRANSERVINKNTRPFGRSEQSLLSRKIDQLRLVREIDEIVVSTNDPAVLDFVIRLGDSRVVVDKRPEDLCLSTTALDALVEYVGSLFSGKHVLWTHTTSPFLGSAFYSRAIGRYLTGLDEGYDSVVSVQKELDFFLFRGLPLNFGGDDLYWPRTQDLEPLLRITSGLFLLSSEVMVQTKNRIGLRPIFVETNLLESIDIDTDEDFSLATLIAQSEGDGD